jgi:cytochrome c biogenesis protein CcdA
MTDAYLLGTLSAFWLGILTSISPCPLATNVAAISFIGRQVGNTRVVFASGLLYTVGRMLAYVALAMLLVYSLLSAGVALPLMKYMHKFIGPLLILLGMVLLELLTLGRFNIGLGARVQEHADRWGFWGAGLLGVVFALTFCPVSAALYFGSLMPLAVKCDSALVLPSLYGLGTGLPVLVFAIMIALGAQSVGKVYNRMAQIEWWGRRLTGAVLIGLGFYSCLVYSYGIPVRDYVLKIVSW